MEPEISKEDFFKFIVKLGIFSAMGMDWPAFNTLNSTATGLLIEMGLLDEFLAASKKMGIPRHQLMDVGKC